MFNFLPTHQQSKFDDNFSTCSEQEEPVDYFGFFNDGLSSNTDSGKIKGKKKNRNKNKKSKSNLLDEQRFETIFNKCDHQATTTNSEIETKSFDNKNFISIDSSSSESHDIQSSKKHGNKSFKHKSLPISIISQNYDHLKQRNSLSKSPFDYKKGLESLQIEIERNFDKSFQVPSKRLPSWKLF
ncbi:hypothetical protein M0813_05860 [Anaeramoeba flamelloides]|uniref:Uncharacterized protein n=1 Tax=Anaeramoeba flamelloides TaxID=1746091 RepID=A0ABQ8XJG3_9EUKA|nr:hypothetical protein M0813_05860 [Anaeramoeba flamelloides]